ncbi:MAG: hypothetical protein R3E58_15585 [Phycisphaerae bacterium]
MEIDLGVWTLVQGNGISDDGNVIAGFAGNTSTGQRHEDLGSSYRNRNRSF